MYEAREKIKSGSERTSRGREAYVQLAKVYYQNDGNGAKDHYKTADDAERDRHSTVALQMKLLLDSERLKTHSDNCSVVRAKLSLVRLITHVHCLRGCK